MNDRYPSSMRKLAAVLLLLAAAVSVSAQKRRAVAPPWNDPRQSATAWLKSNAIAFDSAEPGTGLDDLMPLRRVIGDARIVSLGEATHGTHEFFAMKARFVEFLVTEMGFTLFGIEAALPETDRVNDYVLHGIGDPGTAVAGMGFWTWNVDEVVDLAIWMRNYNLTRGDKPPVQFRGFDMQSSAYAIEALTRYLQRVDPNGAAAVISRWSCWSRFVPSTVGYNGQSASTKNACAADLQGLYDTIASRREAYTAASSAGEFETHLRYARVMQMDEGQAANRQPGRDPWMAENVVWLANVAHPGEKMILWAHNFHVGAELGFTMGRGIREAFPGRQMVIFGFVFDQGEFHARGVTATGVGPVVKHRVFPVEPGVETLLRTAGLPRMIVDLRDISSTEAKRFFDTPQRSWFIGAVFDGARSEFNRSITTFRGAYDAVIWFSDTTASKLR